MCSFIPVQPRAHCSIDIIYVTTRRPDLLMEKLELLRHEQRRFYRLVNRKLDRLEDAVTRLEAVVSVLVGLFEFVGRRTEQCT